MQGFFVLYLGCMKDWLFFRIKHSQKNYIDLYCKQEGQYIEIYITGLKKGIEIILFHDRLFGSIDTLKFDQTLSKINWIKATKDFKKLNYKYQGFDDYESSKIPGHEKKLDFIKYQIGNTINTSFDNRSYSRHIKKNIIGTWKAGDITLVFNEDESFEMIGTPLINTTLAGTVEKGWIYNKRNFLTFLRADRQGGHSMSVYNLTEDTLILHGYSSFLFLVFKRI
jgi:hypothetical protein